MKKFEYLTKKAKSKGCSFTDEKLNKMGEDGWVLISAYLDFYNNMTYIFKREIKDNEI